MNVMLQSHFAIDSQFQPDHVFIGGRILEIDQILNQALFAPNKVAELRDTFYSNTPFPHLVFEGLFSPVLLELMYKDFDSLKWSDWRRYENINESKRGSAPNIRLGHATQLYFNTIYSSPFVNFLKQITGINGLIADVTLNNGGLHEIPTGGKFAVHIDFNQDSVTKLDNRLVFITYLNKDWLPSYGGALELWSAEEHKCAAKIVPVFGRSILFYQTGTSLHGHPDPVNAPEGRPRRSAAAYFYSHGRPEGEESTSFHTTLFPMPVTHSQGERIMGIVKYVTPPAIVDTVRKLKTIINR
jgi:Rps23 Pro-64 3,4-dihydroxylase Tpa1-like proline 4-hydroxylase